MSDRIIWFLFFCLLFNLPVLAQKSTALTQNNVVWTTPSEDSFGSMPLGNGSIGLNYWYAFRLE